jgi:ABC-type bacteriocin/lantibiotic exporter with double-glycine peptidase domain
LSSRRFFVPEVLQTSGSDCGPAVLKAVLAGWGISVNYALLRDACGTGADGTSIDTLESLCGDLGLDVRQEMAPLADARDVLESVLPCIVIIAASGGHHFVVVWRKLGPFWLIMDPGRGRHWVRAKTFVKELFIHRQQMDGESFAAWFEQSAWKRLLTRRLATLGAGDLLPARPGPGVAEQIAAVDGMARLVEALSKRGVVARGKRSEMLRNLVRADLESEATVLPTSISGTTKNGDGTFESMHGIVFLTVRRPEHGADVAPPEPTELARALFGTREPRPFDVFRRNLSHGERRDVAVLFGITLMISGLAFAEMFFLRAAFNASSLLTLPQQRVAGTALYALIVGVLFVLELLLSIGTWRFARALELRTRIALLMKLPKLPDRYFRTRPKFDIVHRCLGLFDVKNVPPIVSALAMRSIDLLVTCTALLIVYPRGAPYVLGTLVFGLVIPYLSIHVRSRVEHRKQTHASALAGLYLDSLLGLVPIRNHGGQVAMRIRQEELLIDWRLESERSVSILALTEAVQLIGLLAAISLLLLDYTQRAVTPTALLLIAFWALRLPFQAQGLLASMHRVPNVNATLARLVEPLTAEDSEGKTRPVDEVTMVLSNRAGMRVDVSQVSATRGAAPVLQGASVGIAAGERIAIVGSSGAGKSSLIAILLGLLDRTAGELLIDGVPLEEYDLGRLRRETVWVDPNVQLWDRALLDNVLFGNPDLARHPIHEVLESLLLDELLEKVPEGLASKLGEGGSRLSGGEGQRVRLSRALLRRGARLFLLDEAFRGLERPVRRALSRRVRTRAPTATIIEVTHDVADTGDFDRVVVIEGGHIVEIGTPAELLARSDSRYAELVRSDVRVEQEIWGAPSWRRLVVRDGKVVEGSA